MGAQYCDQYYAWPVQNCRLQRIAPEPFYDKNATQKVINGYVKQVITISKAIARLAKEGGMA